MFLVELNKFGGAHESRKPGSGVLTRTQDRSAPSSCRERAKALQEGEHEGHMVPTGAGRPTCSSRTREAAASRSPRAEKLAVFRNSFSRDWGTTTATATGRLRRERLRLQQPLPERRKGRFSDVTKKGSASIGFGMARPGATTTATETDDSTSPTCTARPGAGSSRRSGPRSRIRGMARGNRCSDDGDAFTQDVRVEAPALPWRKRAGPGAASSSTSNNDGDLDIFALSGNYTAPKGSRNPSNCEARTGARSCAMRSGRAEVADLWRG